MFYLHIFIYTLNVINTLFILLLHIILVMFSYVVDYFLIYN